MAQLREVNPRDYVERGTAWHAFVGYIVFGLIVVFTTLITSGIALIAWIVIGLINLFRAKVVLATIHGSAVKVGPNQFPDIHTMTEEIAAAMGIEPPEIYILEGHQQNAFASKIWRKNFVILMDDIIHGTHLIQKPDALRFIVAHELAHHALGHLGPIRAAIRSVYLPLSRLDELSCDAVAAAILGRQAGFDALKLLAVGPQLFARVDDDALAHQCVEVEDNTRTKKAERPLSHPLILRRLGRMIPDSAASSA